MHPPSLSCRLDNNIDLALLEHQYIPNLIAVPFVVNHDYCERVLKETNSEELKKVVKEIGNLDNLSPKVWHRVRNSYLLHSVALNVLSQSTVFSSLLLSFTASFLPFFLACWPATS